MKKIPALQTSNSIGHEQTATPARIVLENQEQKDEIGMAIDAIKALRKQSEPISLSELLSARHEGHCEERSDAAIQGSNAQN